jgi:hypothetical protein
MRLEALPAAVNKIVRAQMNRSHCILVLLLVFAHGQDANAQFFAAMKTGYWEERMTFNFARFSREAKEPFVTRFGADFPSVQECLEFSEASGRWYVEHFGIYTFAPDGKCILESTATTENRLHRKIQHRVIREGTWKLSYRAFTPEEREKLGIDKGKERLEIDKDIEYKTHFLAIHLKTVKVEPSPKSFISEEEQKRFEARYYGAHLKVENVYALDEQGTYDVDGRSSSVRSSRTDRKFRRSTPAQLHWLNVRYFGWQNRSDNPGEQCLVMTHAE